MSDKKTKSVEVEAETEPVRLIRLEREDREKLQQLERDFDAVVPRWTAIQEKAEHLAALLETSGNSYDRRVSERLWAARWPKMKDDLAKLVNERDDLTVGIEAEIRAVKSQIFRRHSLISGGFGSWASMISTQFPSLAEELAEARRTVEKMDDLAGKIDFISTWVKKLADLDDGPVSIPLLNVGHLIRRASEVGAEVTAA
jgi:hypothetical protein